MRISDWSSDVCSSDLDRVHYFRTAKRGIAGQICEAYDPAGSGVLIANDYSITTSRSDFFCNGFAADSLPRERLVPPLVSDDAQYLDIFSEDRRRSTSLFLRQIGRASCRERVCQYV